MSNMEQYDNLRTPPADALKEIKGGRLKGKTDISPQWRYEAMTRAYGPIGSGWTYAINRVWREDGVNGSVFAFAEIAVRVKVGPEWSEPIPGIGGSELISKESGGLYGNDEGYKMAVTDALSVALKMLGVGADIYRGLWDGSKYRNTQDPPVAKKPAATEKPSTSALRENLKSQVREAERQGLLSLTQCEETLTILDTKPDAELDAYATKLRGSLDRKRAEAAKPQQDL